MFLYQYSLSSIIAASPSQLFTEYGRLAMDEIFLKPFQVRENLDTFLLMSDEVSQMEVLSKVFLFLSR